MTLITLAAHPLSLAPGSLLIWAAHFALAYGANALACERRWPAGLPGVEVVVLGGAVLALLLLVLIGVRTWWRRADRARDAAPFLARLAVGAALLSAMAVLWQSLAVLVIAPCSGGT